MIRRAPKRRSTARHAAGLIRLERLEDRRLMTAGVASPATDLAGFTQYAAGLYARPVADPPAATVTPLGTPYGGDGGGTDPLPGPYTPAQIKAFTGSTGPATTARARPSRSSPPSDDPTVANDLASFDARFNLPVADFTRVYTSGSSSTTTAPAYDAGSAATIALDVEWAHAIAPGAKILLVEAATNSDADLLGAVDYAVAQGANQVALSFARGEYAGNSAIDTHFNKPGVSFFAGAGDDGTQVVSPAVSPYVTGVGGTTISIDQAGEKLSETAWSSSGGGASVNVARPSFQNGFQAASGRGRPRRRV